MLTRQRAKWPREIANTAFEPPGRAGATEIAVTFIGHATFLIQIGIAVLTDPIWSSRASPLSFAGPRRVREPGQPLGALPAVDLLLVSHCHYDHLDLPTLRALQARWSPVTATGLGNGRHLAKAGIGNAHELDWWQARVVRNARITYVPAQHFSARTLLDHNHALWGGFVIEAGDHTIYFAGDTGYSAHFREVRERFPSIDLALLPIGAYEPRWFMSFHHMNPEEAVRAHRDLGARQSIGMHHGTFQLTDEAIDAPTKALAFARSTLGVPEERFRTLEVGENMLLHSASARTESGRS
jgi:L-ascorbate metabolism protein UlaG (beta-lactamase superfamily)